MSDPPVPVKIEPFHLGHFDAVGPEGPLYSHAPPLTSTLKWEASIPFPIDTQPEIEWFSETLGIVRYFFGFTGSNHLQSEFLKS